MRRKAFVIMPFRKSLNSYYPKIFRPALESEGYEVTRSDDLFLPRPIIEDIQESIRNADLILCEMTGRNPNVFYELGLAHAIGKPAILISNTRNDVPFDLHHVRAIFYNPSEVGWEEKLYQDIKLAAAAARKLRIIWPTPLISNNRTLTSIKVITIADFMRNEERLENGDSVLVFTNTLEYDRKEMLGTILTNLKKGVIYKYILCGDKLVKRDWELFRQSLKENMVKRPPEAKIEVTQIAPLIKATTAIHEHKDPVNHPYEAYSVLGHIFESDTCIELSRSVARTTRDYFWQVWEGLK